MQIWWQSMLLPHVLNRMWSAECAEFASTVIELVIGILLSPANNYMPFLQHYKLHQLLWSEITTTGNWVLRAAGNETILCAAELTGLSFQKLPYICHWFKFWKSKCSSLGGGPNFSEGVHILQWNKSWVVLNYWNWGVHFYHDRHTNTNAVTKTTQLCISG